MVGNTPFAYRLVGTTGCEILADGVVVAWTVDEPWAALMVALLNGAEDGAPTFSAAGHGDARNPSIPE